MRLWRITDVGPALSIIIIHFHHHRHVIFSISISISISISTSVSISISISSGSSNSAGRQRPFTIRRWRVAGARRAFSIVVFTVIVDNDHILDNAGDVCRIDSPFRLFFVWSCCCCGCCCCCDCHIIRSSRRSGLGGDSATARSLAT